MKLSLKARDLPGRVATGAYILHAGLDKWGGDEARAVAVHGMAAGAFPVSEGHSSEDLLEGSRRLRGRNRGRSSYRPSCPMQLLGRLSQDSPAA